jgi:methylase of polypeptide subunit release factors
VIPRTAAPTAASAAGPLRLEDGEAIVELRAVLDDANYTADGLSAALRATDAAPSDLREIPYFDRLLPRGERLTTLIELFHFGVAVERAEAADALAPVSLERLERLGLLTETAQGARARVALLPFDGLVIVSDQQTPRGHEPRDHVMDVSMPSLLLASVSMRPQVGSGLDLCTGSGVQAFLAARHAARVVAVDINPRALNLAAFGARLNRIAHVELREGDLFDPVAGERFDLVFANPPYVVSPETGLLLRDGGMPGDSFSESLVRRAPDFLEHGGYAHVVVNWAHSADEHWSEPIRRWVADTGCDALLLHQVSQAPLDYAAVWNRDLREDRAAYARALDRWTEYHRRHGIEAIGSGVVILRRRDGANWVRDEELSSDLLLPADHHIARLIENQDYLAVHDGRALLDDRFCLADDHLLDQTGRFGEDGGIQRRVLRLENGLRWQVAVDANTAMVLSRLDGRRTLSEVLAAAAEEADEKAPPPDRFLEAGLGAVRRLLELGFVVPAED